MFIPKVEGSQEPLLARVFDAVDDEDHTMTTMRVAMAEALKQPVKVEETKAPAERVKADGETKPVEFTDLYHQYFPKVFAYVYGRVQDKEISLDIVSDVFEKAFIKMRSLRSPDSFGSWLFTIARNEVSSHWRKTKPAARAAQEAAWETELHSQPRGPEETVLHKERLASLSQLVRQLPRREQEIIALKFDAELSNREIANVLSTSEVNVRVTVFRALRKLRERLQVSGDRT
ncbi:MAG: sigma-70 family RNA polymerase sigma factor [Chloroflexi bacterium]|nr:MAG: sigma-70 family RNA polymerase sigma factor [Chloroflexota bacterium]